MFLWVNNLWEGNYISKAQVTITLGKDMMQSQRCVSPFEELFSFSFYIPLLPEAGNVCLPLWRRYTSFSSVDTCKMFAVFAPSRSSPYVTITLKTMFEPLYRELYTFDPTFFFTPSFLKAINGDTVESFGSVVSVSSPGIFVSEMLQPKFYEMMLSKVDKFGEWVNVAKIQITKPNTMRKYVFPEVCGSKSDSQNGFVVEYGTDRDIDLGFHVDDSELTSNVSLSKHFEGEELYFRGTRCKKHDVNTDTKPEEMFGDSHTPDQAVLRHGDRATTSGHGVDMILWSRRDAIISEGILKLMRSKLLRKEIKAKPDSCCQKKEGEAEA